jgi:hypothetical protein
MIKEAINIKFLLLIPIFFVSLFFVAFTPNQGSSGQELIYGIVNIKKCNSEGFEYFVSQVSDPEKVYKYKKNLESVLRKQYPDALIRISTSSFDYGPSANNMCVIRWVSGTKNCQYYVASVAFGKSQTEAYNRAIQIKNNNSEKGATYIIIKQVSW